MDGAEPGRKVLGPARRSFQQLYNLVFVGLIAGVIGARLTYLITYPEAFSSSPLSLVSLNPGLLDPLGGLAVGTIAAIIYAQRVKLALWSVLDALTPLLAVMMIALGISHLASGVAFGAETQAPWAIELWGARRHPSQVYEILSATAILAVLWPEGEPDSTSRALFPAVLRIERSIVVVFRGIPGGQPASGGGLADDAGNGVAGVGRQPVGLKLRGSQQPTSPTSLKLLLSVFSTLKPEKPLEGGVKAASPFGS